MPLTIVAGACGFIGTNLCLSLLKEGRSVLGIDNFITGSRANLAHLQNFSQSSPGSFSFVEADVCQDWQTFLKSDHISQKIDLLFFLASPASPNRYLQFPLETAQVNTQGLLKALNFATYKSARLIFTSTSEIYGKPDRIPIPESYFGSVDPYALRACYQESKRMGESLVRIINDRHGGQHGIVRLFNIYGPYTHPEDDRVIPQFIRRAQMGQKLLVHGDGSQTRSFCHIEDLMAQLMFYANSSLQLPMNLGNNDEVSILQLAETVLEIFSLPKDHLEFVKPMAGEPVRRCPSLDFMEQSFSYKNQISLFQGLAKTLQSSLAIVDSPS